MNVWWSAGVYIPAAKSKLSLRNTSAFLYFRAASRTDARWNLHPTNAESWIENATRSPDFLRAVTSLFSDVTNTWWTHHCIYSHLVMPQLTESLSREAIVSALSGIRMNAQDRRTLLRFEAWNSLRSRNEQLAFLAELSETECAKILHSSTLAEIFNISPPHVHEFLARVHSTPGASCRPLELPSKQKEMACCFIKKGYTSRNYVTQRHVLDFVDSTFRITLRYGWVRCFVQLRSQQIVQQVLLPHEQPRIQVLHAHLNWYRPLIQTLVRLFPAELVYNMDDPGLSDWEECSEKKVVMTVQVAGSALH
jgi:hypothetical protein